MASPSTYRPPRRPRHLRGTPAGPPRRQATRVQVDGCCGCSWLRPPVPRPARPPCQGPAPESSPHAPPGSRERHHGSVSWGRRRPAGPRAGVRRGARRPGRREPDDALTAAIEARPHRDPFGSDLHAAGSVPSSPVFGAARHRARSGLAECTRRTGTPRPRRVATVPSPARRPPPAPQAPARPASPAPAAARTAPGANFPGPERPAPPPPPSDR